MAITLTSSKHFLSLPNPSKHHQHQHQIPHKLISCKATSTIIINNDTNLYKVLSLNPKESSLEEIKKAYRNMALRYHPDVCHGHSMTKEESTEMFLQVQKAYKTLSDPVLREEYDNGLLMGMTRGFRASRNDSLATRNRWRDQLVELKIRSKNRMAQREGSWASRMRTQKHNKD
ncbi:chaperone protein DNAj, putative [Ricinus communis]|uniref:Chaperone protein DNAj, putative n=2 Tax=Ricinus communis TaxID=3988 RepID=B9T7D6_RICCO|nr:chaperone protein DNAj, putative [Ricinus communis]